MKASITDGEASIFSGDYVNTSRTVICSTNSQAISSVLSAGIYELVSDVDIHFVQGSSGLIANIAAGNTHWSRAGVSRVFSVSGSSDGWVACAIEGGSNGSLYISKRGPT